MGFLRSAKGVSCTYGRPGGFPPPQQLEPRGQGQGQGPGQEPRQEPQQEQEQEQEQEPEPPGSVPPVGRRGGGV